MPDTVYRVYTVGATGTCGCIRDPLNINDTPPDTTTFMAQVRGYQRKGISATVEKQLAI